MYALVIATGLKELFERTFIGKIRAWKRSSIVLLHLFSKFSSIDRIYKINKNICRFFYYFFDVEEERNPLKDDVYELQKKISDGLGQLLKERLLKYYHDNDFLDLSLVFIDGHVITYFGKEAFQKLKHGTRKKILKALEVFNFSDRNGRIFYFRADHDVEGMQKNIEKLLAEVRGIMGLDRVRILVFDRGGFSGKLFRRLNNEFKLKFITLAVQNEDVEKQIAQIKKKKKFKRLPGSDKKKYTIASLKIDGRDYRTLLNLNIETGEINPFITNMDEDELPNGELLKCYSMHWRQEQEHNAFKKIGGDMHAKALQEIEFEDTTKLRQRKKLRNKIDRWSNEIIRLNLQAKKLENRRFSMESNIKPASKKLDKKYFKQEKNHLENRLKEIANKIQNTSLDIEKAKKRLKRIPENPKKKKYKYGPVDYSISIVNLANILNSRLVEIFSDGKKKFQLATLKSILYCASARVWEDGNLINIEYINIRQDKDIEGVKRLCKYFNERDVMLHGKMMRFGVEDPEENTKNKNSILGLA